MVKVHLKKRITLLALVALTLTACGSKSSTFEKIVDKALEEQGTKTSNEKKKKLSIK